MTFSAILFCSFRPTAFDKCPDPYPKSVADSVIFDLRFALDGGYIGPLAATGNIFWQKGDGSD
jgi:hypothetical protein